ncbi:uncharacterized protein LOC127364299 [Dicentrarchus labrax]|uniref:Interleukin 4/13-2 n=1 Tax=Dicentrarchus labrax TaxID=13489 RepID=A0A076YF48_DICLA|nr:uncharacterized protein LOC127364299 [Dicentrarchus labrax]AIK66533.1 interleukin 4/13-2 [Dicentrarchus labrax]AKK32390.1 interleukin 4/13-2 [Dicentrarchus labrax]
MKMGMLLLVSALVLLSAVSPTIASPSPHHHKNLNIVFDMAQKYNESLSRMYFVEDVSSLADGANKCQDKFFCKVYMILREHEELINRSEERGLVKNLKKFVDGINANCTELLKDVVPSDVTKPIPSLLEHLTRCIQSLNMRRSD